jgi:hypothetical protein
MISRLTLLIGITSFGALPFLQCVAVMPVSPQLEISGLKSSYAANTPIPFTITKRISAEVAFACAAETQIHGQWHEVRWDIFSKADKALSRSRSHTIRSDASEMIWDVSNLKPHLRPKAGWSYRLRVDVLTPKEESIYSPVFSIEK